MNGFCPIGPSIVTPDEMADPHNLNLKCIVNGVTKQDSNTKQLVFKTEEIVSWCSKFCTLLPGDLILTGTPPGVGCFKNPPEFLKVCVFFIYLGKFWNWDFFYLRQVVESVQYMNLKYTAKFSKVGTKVVLKK